jgi:acetyl esterase/lipase
MPGSKAHFRSDVVDRRSVLQSAILAAVPSVLSGCISSAPQSSSQDPLTIESAGVVTDLWPGKPPGGEHVTAVQAEVERSKDPTFHDVAIVHTTTPTLTFFPAPHPNGASVLIIPGGSYQRVVVGKEGYEIANWLASHGIGAFVLLYRLPADGWAAGPDAPLQDAQRAMRLIRSRAQKLGLDPTRVAVMGFSAGGHLAARLATRFDLETYTRVDAADSLSSRPDLAALGYPVISFAEGVAHAISRIQMLGPNPTSEQIRAYSAEIDVTARAPPCFLMCAADDTAVPVENSILMFRALRRVNVPAALHIFDRGGHGFGLRAAQDPSAGLWPELFLEWSRGHGFVDARSLSPTVHRSA